MSSSDALNQKSKHYLNIMYQLPEEVLDILALEQKDMLIEKVAYLIHHSETLAIESVLKKCRGYKQHIEYRYKSTLKAVEPSLEVNTLKTESLKQTMERISKMADLSIEDVYHAQDASDMFFNNEIVIKAFQKALSETSETEKEIEEAFIQNLKEDGFFTDDEHIQIVVKDFLARV